MNIMERRRQSFFTLCLSIVKELGASNARATFKPIVRKKWHFSYSLTLLFVFFALLRGCHIITVGRFEVCTSKFFKDRQQTKENKVFENRARVIRKVQKSNFLNQFQSQTVKVKKLYSKLEVMNSFNLVIISIG